MALNTLFPQVDDAASRNVQESFVEQRRSSPKTVNENTLHQQLTVARLLCLSHLESSLSPERWAQAVQLCAAFMGPPAQQQQQQEQASPVAMS
jgi:hypothetical protein